MIKEMESVDCPVCGPSQTRIWLDDSQLTKYVCCQKCRTVFASPRLSQRERHAETNNVWTFSPWLVSFEARRRPALLQEAEFIQRYVQSGRFLDVGCSSGDLFEFFPSPAWERYGVELSASAAAYSRQFHSADVFAGTLESASWPSKFFDLVSMIDMLYYVDDPMRELSEVRRILKPTGFLAIEITGQAYMFFRSRGVIALVLDGRWCRLNSESHYTFWFNPTGLQQLLENVGYRLVAWRIVPGPTRPNRFSNFVSSTYYRVYSTLAGHSMKMLNWAPKYIFLAERG
jgi:SAM-dependent methyltransferase